MFHVCYVQNMSIYYTQKYSFEYPFVEDDGTPMIMCTISVPDLMGIFCRRIGRYPRSFFDCGAATGVMVAMAQGYGMHARGIDVRRYTAHQPTAKFTEHLFANGHIKIESILDTAPIDADLAYCNGTLTYMNEMTLPLALSKFKNVGMLIAIHNTTEDIVAAERIGDPIVHSEPRLIRSNQWWLDVFRKNGFRAEFNAQYKCFCVRPLHTKLQANRLQRFNKCAGIQLAYAGRISVR
ncbi:hypothetical protein HDR61_04570 [bacterium]|nr:hypothetical protein [bacterium]